MDDDEVCWEIVMHFRDYKEARSVLDAASVDSDRMFRIELKEGPRKHLK